MIFRSPEHALKWAYETTSRPIVKISSVNAMRGASGSNNDELTAHDKHAQAAFILALCERVLTSLHMAYVQAQFGRDRSGFDLLVRHMATNFGTGIHSRRGIEQIIRSYCGEKGGLREIKKSMSTGLLKAASFRNRGYDALDAIHAQAMSVLWDEMQGRMLLAAGA
ncbi:hypothetical protein SAMN05216428_102355 [Nitrosospira sp. Nsp11]|uniref:hypothetical protein n=1 Tax=Nitrosospira sp. Nsp11 TaxID=1855338 RepID=UPI00090FF7D0|nr:hypothetical protein [Nitrosospira sp. Nsp11]SHL42264.1 hypothetical protein SAMN05216428_102355 [Nitrosospira sp. Nsp11]